MKRKRLILTTVLLAGVVAVMVHVHSPSTLKQRIWRSWRTVIYEEKQSDENHTYYEKRVSWLPGYRMHFPDQVCSSCRNGGHDSCWLSLALTLSQERSSCKHRHRPHL